MQELDVIVEVDNIISQLPVSPEKLQEFRDNIANDADLQLLQNTVTRDGLWKEAKYLKPFDHILHFATKLCTAMACFFKESACSTKSNASRNVVTYSRKSSRYR